MTNLTAISANRLNRQNSIASDAAVNGNSNTPNKLWQLISCLKSCFMPRPRVGAQVVDMRAVAPPGSRQLNLDELSTTNYGAVGYNSVSSDPSSESEGGWESVNSHSTNNSGSPSISIDPPADPRINKSGINKYQKPLHIAEGHKTLGLFSRDPKEPSSSAVTHSVAKRNPYGKLGRNTHKDTTKNKSEYGVDTAEGAKTRLEKASVRTQAQQKNDPLEVYAALLLNIEVEALVNPTRSAVQTSYAAGPVKIPFACSTLVNKKRPSDPNPVSEDRFMAIPFSFQLGSQHHSGTLTAVLDGHGGEEVAEFTKNYIADYLSAAIEGKNKNFVELGEEGVVYNALRQACVDVDQAVFNQFGETPPGSTLNLGLQFDNSKNESVIYFANVGDSRAILVQPGAQNSIVQCTEDQGLDPIGPHLLPRVTRQGGKVENPIYNGHRTESKYMTENDTNGRLLRAVQMPRSIGDGVPGGSPLPKVSRFVVKKTDGPHFIVQVTDGVTDKISTNELGKLLIDHLNTKQPIQDFSADIAAEARLRGSRDDITVLVSQSQSELEIRNSYREAETSYIAARDHLVASKNNTSELDDQFKEIVRAYAERPHSDQTADDEIDVFKEFLEERKVINEERLSRGVDLLQPGQIEL